MYVRVWWDGLTLRDARLSAPGLLELRFSRDWAIRTVAATAETNKKEENKKKSAAEHKLYCFSQIWDIIDIISICTLPVNFMSFLCRLDSSSIGSDGHT